jgi:hypothetical protein
VLGRYDDAPCSQLRGVVALRAQAYRRDVESSGLSRRHCSCASREKVRAARPERRLQLHAAVMAPAERWPNSEPFAFMSPNAPAAPVRLRRPCIRGRCRRHERPARLEMPRGSTVARLNRPTGCSTTEQRATRSSPPSRPIHTLVSNVRFPSSVQPILSNIALALRLAGDSGRVGGDSVQ